MENENTEGRWLTRAEVAERLRVPKGTVADWACKSSKTSGPPYRRVGKHTRYRLSDLIAWENEQHPRQQTD